MGKGLVINVYVASDMHMGYDVTRDRKAYVTTQSGRFQCITPNIQNIPKSRDYFEAEHLWSECRKEQQATEFAQCNECLERFRCWTAGRPERIVFMSPELDYTQMHLRMAQIQQSMKATMITIDEAKQAFDNFSYGVSKDALG